MATHRTADKLIVADILETLQRQLADAEKLLARHGLRRPPSMTIGRYLARLREADHIPQQVRQQAEPLLVEYQTHRFRRPAE